MNKVRNPIVLVDYDNRNLAKPLEPIVDEEYHDLFIRNKDGVTNTSLYETFRQRLLEDDYIINVDLDHTTPNTIFGFNIDLDNKDSYDSVTYSDECTTYIPISFNEDGTAEYGSWFKYMESVFGIRPCLFKDGEVLHYLSDYDYGLTDDEVPLDITTGDSGDIMIEFKQTYYKFEIVNNILMFRVANYKVDSTYYSDAFIEVGSGLSLKDFMYISAYDNIILNDVVRSISGANIVDIIQHSAQECRDLCARGDSYYQITLAKYLYLLALSWLFLKNRNLSNILPSNVTTTTTGTMDKGGLFYKGQNGYKLLGIENIFSKLLYLEGAILSNNTLYYRPSGEYVSDKRKYTRYPDINFLINGYISNVDVVENRILIPNMIEGIGSDNFGILNTVRSTDDDILLCANHNNIIFDNDMEAYPRFIYC